MAEEITIRRGFKLGELDAEADKSLLESCFVDNGLLDDLLDVNSPLSIVLGRTGSGKSALLHMVTTKAQHFVLLDPNDISIRYLEQSTIIRFFSGLGIKMDLLYRFLWKHILTVEVIKLRFGLEGQVNKSQIARIKEKLQPSLRKTKNQGVDYFESWGETFWQSSDEHLTNITSKITTDLEAKLKAKFPALEITSGAAETMTDEVKLEIQSLATQVVSSKQMRELREVQSALERYAFDDVQKKYYILIDNLDEDWAETDTRCRFIRALIEETKSFRKMSQLKIISALRRDLLDLVFDKTRDSGFQEEKYDAYIARIGWTPEELKALLEFRIQEIYKRQYTKDNVRINDIFPSAKHHNKDMKVTSCQYLIDRTLLRPRDVLQFSNECFIAAVNRERISWKTIHAAEAVYSHKRLKSLQEEWGELYPALECSIELIRGVYKSFSRSSITEDVVAEVANELCGQDNTDPCVKVAKELFESGKTTKVSDFVSQVLICLYRVGAIGVKVSSLESFNWSFIDQATIKKSELRRVNQIKVHKMLRHTLEIKEKKLSIKTS